jgi:asparagine synthase (glutamine-hydrolysing)
LFASEIKALFSDNRIERELDPAGLSETFTFWSPVAPRTVFKKIRELEPGHFAVLREGHLDIKPYWRISFPGAELDSPLTEEENSQLLRKHLIEASKLRFTRSDVPVGAYLSGGIDSSITASIINNYTNAPLKTFSLRFKDAEFDEGLYQKEMVEKLGADHRDVIISLADINQAFSKVVWHAERPILRTAPVPMYLLSKLVRESGYKVVVTGEGADEVLAGYDIFKEAIARRFLARDPSSKKRKDIFIALYPWMLRSPNRVPTFSSSFFGRELDLKDPVFSHRPRWNTTMKIKQILNTELRREIEHHDIIEDLLMRMPESHEKWDLLGRSQWLETTTLLPGYILSAQGDRMMMANSVEGRFPFLDYLLVDFSNQLPARHKILALDEKHLLKKAFQDIIPKSILNRPKQPYRAPDAASFFYNRNTDWVEALLSKKNISEAGVFSPVAIDRLKSKCERVNGYNMSNTDNMMILAVLSTMLLYQQYIKEDGWSNLEATPAQPMKVIDRA